MPPCIGIKLAGMDKPKHPELTARNFPSAEEEAATVPEPALYAGPESAYRLADRLVQALGQPTEIEAHALQIGASVGIVLSPGDGTEAEELLRKADSAMYLAKATGRGCARIYGT